jgi:uncharacterized protein YkwD
MPAAVGATVVALGLGVFLASGSPSHHAKTVAGQPAATASPSSSPASAAVADDASTAPAPVDGAAQIRARARFVALPSVAAPAAPRQTTVAGNRPPAAAPAPPAAGGGGAASQSSWASAVLSVLNSQRAQNGLGPLSSNSKLIASAHAHNLKMAAANSMSHQLPGEASLGSRVSAAGYSWSSCGENIGWTTDKSQGGAISLENSMYNETPPNDGHRRNILSTSFTQVGIDVIVDPGTGKLWITEDFGQP